MDCVGVTIRRFASDGRLEASFGEVYDSGEPTADLHLRRGRMACDQRSHEIIYGPAGALGELRVFAGDGTPRRRFVIADFKPIHVTSQGPRTWVTVPAGGFNSLHALEAVPGGGFLAQYTYRDRAGTEFVDLHTVLITDQRGRGLSIDLRSVVEVTATYYAVVENDPYPVVRVFAF